MKSKKLLSLIALMLAIVSFLLTPLQVFADATPKYIEDMIIVAATNEADAQKLAGSDYTVMKTPIYDGSSGETGVNKRVKKSYLCYKVTTNPRNAITEIKALNMNAPWDYKTYNSYLETLKSDIAEEVDAMAAAVDEILRTQRATASRSPTTSMKLCSTCMTT